MEIKDTLLMPITDFAMRGNLGVREIEIHEKWYNRDLYKEVLKKNEGKPKFILHDGPPYANGDIHIGHALNKIFKDIIVRYKNMNGFYAPYTPGWDTHGLPIENALTKGKKVNRKEMSAGEFRELCKQYAEEQVEKQKEQFLRLGLLGDYENPYVTYQKEFEYHQLIVFSKMVENGFIFKGLKPVYWSPSSESALAEAEIEYHDIVSSTIFVKMQIENATDEFKGANFVIWTTTPWTIPANLAISVGAKIDYVLIDSNKGKLVLAKELLEKVSEKAELTNVSIVKEVKGSELTKYKYKHPLYDRVSPILTGEHVTTTDGTGLVHTAPGHGLEDFMICQENGIEAYCPVDSRGFLDETTGRFKGLFVDDATKEVIKALTEIDALIASESITHSYPHDWRTNKPIIFRATEQWFCNIESMKPELLKEVDNVNWIPSWGKQRMTNMIKDRKEWCISRQRAWGVPIPAIYAENGEVILDKDLIIHFANLVKEEGTNIWFTKDIKELIPANYTHPGSPNNIFRKETDIMDVWFDSGTSYNGGQIPFGQNEKADIYLEGFDQFRGWFNSSLLTSVATTGEAPYKQVVAHGFVLDGQGKKMSKSLGNTINPSKVANTMGADILRLWVLSVAYDQDVRVSDDLLKQVSETYRKIRNTLRFMLGNLNNFDYSKDKIDYKDMSISAKYMMYKIDQLIKDVKNSYDNFQNNEIYKSINYFINKDLSSFYLDFTKDILYIEEEKNISRLEVQTVYHYALDTLVKLLTPIIPHTADEVYQHISSKKFDCSQLEEMPTFADYPRQEEFEKFMEVREDILKALEVAREEKVIGKSFEAHLTLYPSAELKAIFDNIPNLSQILIVSKLTIANEGTGKLQFEGLSIDVKKAEGHVCERCWQIVDELNDRNLCTRCEDVVSNLEK